MRVRNIFYHLVNIIFFLILFNIIHFVFVTITDLDIALNLEWLQYRTEFELEVFKTKELWGYILSFFYACFFDYFYLKKALEPLRLEKYSNEIFTLLGCIPAVLTVGLFIFYKWG